MLQGTGDTLFNARLLRREMSPPEVRLWQALRTRPGSLKFRRQHPSGPYVADFYCHSARLIIEVDGEAHSRGDRPQRDAARDRWFQARRLRIMRIPAVEVLRDCDAVVRGILATAGEDQNA
jgi:very-short-patch-repair endonuclease